MAYDSRATFRPELLQVLEQAVGRDKHLIGADIFPVLPVKERKGIFPKRDVASSRLFAALPQRFRTKHTPYPEVERSFTDQQFVTYDQGGVTRIDEAEAHDLERFFGTMEPEETRWLGFADRRRHELDCAATLFDASEYADTHKHTATVPWTQANAESGDLDVRLDIDTAIQALDDYGIDSSELTLVISRNLWTNVLKLSKSLMQYLYAHTATDATAQTRLITPDTFAKAFEIKNVMLGKSSVSVHEDKINRKAGAADAARVKPCWGSDFIFLGRIGGGDFKSETGGVGRTLVWEKEVPQGGSRGSSYTQGKHANSATGGGGRLQVIESWEDTETRDKVIRCRSHRNVYMVDTLAGYLITTGYVAT